jgi:hypothetical protein
METTNGGRPRGRRARVSREQFLAAGLAVARNRDPKVTNRSLRDLLDVPFADVLEEVSRSEPKPVTPPLLYTHWDDYEHYLSELMPVVFNPEEKVSTADLRDETQPPRDRIRKHVGADLQQADDGAATYLGLFAGIGNPRVFKILTNIYNGYDKEIAGPLAKVLQDDGRQVKPCYGQGDEGIRHLMRALTALTEGFATRRVVQPEDHDNDLLQHAALGIYDKLTEPLG